MNFIRKPITPMTPTPRIVIFIDVVKSSLVGFLTSLSRRPMESRKFLKGNFRSPVICKSDDWTWPSFKFVVNLFR